MPYSDGPDDFCSPSDPPDTSHGHCHDQTQDRDPSALTDPLHVWPRLGVVHKLQQF